MVWILTISELYNFDAALFCFSAVSRCYGHYMLLINVYGASCFFSTKACIKKAAD